MKRPNEKDYFEFRGKRPIIDYGSSENYIGALEEYIDYLEGLNKETPEKELILKAIIDTYNYILKQEQTKETAELLITLFKSQILIENKK
jgi:hypothetical protein